MELYGLRESDLMNSARNSARRFSCILVKNARFHLRIRCTNTFLKCFKLKSHDKKFNHYVCTVSYYSLWLLLSNETPQAVKRLYAGERLRAQSINENRAMRKTLSIQSSVYPPGYQKQPPQPHKAYNRWMRSVQRELDKIYNTDKASKYFI